MLNRTLIFKLFFMSFAANPASSNSASGSTSAPSFSAAAIAPPSQMSPATSGGPALQAAQRAAGNNSATLVRKVFAQQYLPPADENMIRAWTKQCAYWLLRMASGQPLSEDGFSGLMHAQGNMEFITERIPLGASDKGPDLKKSGFWLAPYDTLQQPLINTVCNAFFNPDPNKPLHDLWPDALREDIKSALPENLQGHAVRAIVRAAFAEWGESAKGKDLAALGVMDMGAVLYRLRRSNMPAESLRTSYPATHALRLAEAGDYSWLEFVENASSGLQPSDMDVIQNAWAGGPLAVCRGDAACVRSSRYRVTADFTPEQAEKFFVWTRVLTNALKSNDAVSATFNESIIKYEDQLVDEARNTLDILEQFPLQHPGVLVDRLSGVYSRIPSPFSSVFRAKGREALHKLDEFLGNENDKLTTLLVTNLLEEKCSEEDYLFVVQHANKFLTKEVIVQMKEMVRESETRLAVMNNRSELEFDQMRSSLPDDHVQLVLKISDEEDFYQWQLYLMHLEDRLKEEPDPDRCNVGVQALLDWWGRTWAPYQLDLQIFQILTDSLICNTSQYDIWSALMKKAVPLITPDMGNTVTLYLLKTLKAIFHKRQSEIEVWRQRSRGVEGLRLQALRYGERIKFEEEVFPLFSNLRTQFPDFYHNELKPLIDAI